ncbi:hypothetical protein PHLCEN_2v2940 [Hermanssonia centrifuga]|uniref:Uncharacterized protein n=1 Tax=Hermanssonia centrifuga TaxID=98765 RepID=A0A2R6RIE3_9APHY|nr:hypothetical protein PHLCEN_2v2940 [Hermanssonia centrifuga]
MDGLITDKQPYLAEDVEELLDEGTTVKVCPAKEVVTPDCVASVIAGPPTDVTSTIGTPFDAIRSGQYPQNRPSYRRIAHSLIIVAKA